MSAGREFRANHEKAGKSTKLVNKTVATTRRIIPRSNAIACVSRSEYNNPKKIRVTSVISITLNQLMR